MALSVVPASSPRNRLLTALPPDDLAKLLQQFQPVELELRQILHEPGKTIGSVYFVETGWVSMLAYLEDGDAAEVGLVGREGMVRAAGSARWGQH
ncbi:Crp/Fnr family transcriptional regulator [Belnapia arida]|uniref:Crp/Fnr family transcriptional regulator n=1 Tax=Belnapia arida TaxID=2804533 RepID=UPI001F28A59D|nr:hypothetical protein [Belnapia arida]